ncbi:hypothetical protein Fmac_026372 [Flemingia macrophylla]|uniref:Protein kinase domain-containing protein n=1 Tax=Flemingia macrophylla TaxID=520843 RepID=A0ABD1LF78_9FABA
MVDADVPYGKNFLKITFVVCKADIWPCIHNIVVVTAPIRLHAPPAFAAITTTAPKDFNAKLSDFGLATDGPTGDNTHVSTRVIGSQGYAAPEYVATDDPSFPNSFDTKYTEKQD